MLRIKLETSAGELVTYGAIPVFKMLPDVITWGDRVFRLSLAVSASDAAGNLIPVYRECFAVALVETVSESENADGD